MSKRRRHIPSETQRMVRIRARFKCENCNEFKRNQHAHVIPDSEGGSVELDNILWLCYECHKNFEAHGKSGLLHESLVTSLVEIRDRPKVDSLVHGIFDELLAHQDQPIDIELGNVKFRDIGIFSEPPDSYRPAYLRFSRDGTRLNLAGRLKDIGGHILIEFDGDHLSFHTQDVWDIERRARYLKLFSRSQRLWIELRQLKDLTVSVRGEIYAGGKLISISKANGIQFPAGGGFSKLTFEGSGPHEFAFALPPSPIPRPIGHVDPDIRTT